MTTPSDKLDDGIKFEDVRDKDRDEAPIIWGEPRWNGREWYRVGSSTGATLSDQPTAPLPEIGTHTDHPLRHFDRTCPACTERGRLPEGWDAATWGAWLRDRGSSFDPCVQGPLFNALADWIERSYAQEDNHANVLRRKD